MIGTSGQMDTLAYYQAAFHLLYEGRMKNLNVWHIAIPNFFRQSVQSEKKNSGPSTLVWEDIPNRSQNI